MMSKPVSIRSCIKLQRPLLTITLLIDSGGDGGYSTSGYTQGGYGPGGGGTALSGSTGSSNGGNAENYGFVVSNDYKASQYFYFPTLIPPLIDCLPDSGGDGGYATSGNAICGNA